MAAGAVLGGHYNKSARQPWVGEQLDLAERFALAERVPPRGVGTRPVSRQAVGAITLGG